MNQRRPHNDEHTRYRWTIFVTCVCHHLYDLSIRATSSKNEDFIFRVKALGDKVTANSCTARDNGGRRLAQGLERCSSDASRLHHGGLAYGLEQRVVCGEVAFSGALLRYRA